jgi:hypothetical protein
MAYDVRGNYIPDAALKDRATYLENNPVYYSTDIPGSTIDDEHKISGDERLVFE